MVPPLRRGLIGAALAISVALNVVQLASKPASKPGHHAPSTHPEVAAPAPPSALQSPSHGAARHQGPSTDPPAQPHEHEHPKTIALQHPIAELNSWAYSPLRPADLGIDDPDGAADADANASSGARKDLDGSTRRPLLVRFDWYSNSRA